MKEQYLFQCLYLSTEVKQLIHFGSRLIFSSLVANTKAIITILCRIFKEMTDKAQHTLRRMNDENERLHQEHYVKDIKELQQYIHISNRRAH